MAPLTCPACRGALIARSTGAAQCGRCQGWWLDPAALSTRGARLAADLAVVRSRNPRTCPACAVPMATYRSPRLEIDACDGCQGVWLDHGELELLQTRPARVAAPPRVEPPPEVHPEPPSALAGVASGLLLDGVFELLGAAVGAIFELW